MRGAGLPGASAIWCTYHAIGEEGPVSGKLDLLSTSSCANWTQTSCLGTCKHMYLHKTQMRPGLPLLADGDAGVGELALDLGDGVFAGVDHSRNDGCIGMGFAEDLRQVGGAAGAS